MRIFSLSLLAVWQPPACRRWPSAELAKQHNCLSCHSVDKSGWPSYKDIAAKYKALSPVEAAVDRQNWHGGKGAWPHPGCRPTPMCRDADVKTLVKWILAQ